ncbi:MAG: hypothetical protein ACHP7O_11480, partial [Burkholderiales bacterium]
LVEALDDDAIVQRTKVHTNSFKFNKLGLFAATCCKANLTVQQHCTEKVGRLKKLLALSSNEC